MDASGKRARVQSRRERKLVCPTFKFSSSVLLSPFQTADAIARFSLHSRDLFTGERSNRDKSEETTRINRSKSQKCTKSKVLDRERARTKISSGVLLPPSGVVRFVEKIRDAVCKRRDFVLFFFFFVAVEIVEI